MRAILDRVVAIGRLVALTMRSDPGRTALALTPAIPIASGVSYLSARQLLDALPRENRSSIAVAAALFTVAFIANVWLGRVVRTARIKLGHSAIFEFNRRRLAAVLAPKGVEHFEEPSYLDRLEIVRTRIFDIGQAPRMLGWLVDSGGGIVVAVVLLLTVHPVIGLVVLGGIPAALLNGRAQRRVEASREAETSRGRRALHLYDTATKPAAAKEVRVYGLRNELLERYGREWRASDRALFREEMRAGAIRAAGWLVQAAAFGLGVAVLFGGIREGTVTAGDVFLVLGAMGLVVGQFTQMAGGLSSLGRIARLFEHLASLEAEARPPELTGNLNDQPPERIQQGITIENLNFRYATATTNALSDVNLFLPAGSVVAIVGDNGAGKSTFVKLLFGLYRPSGGRILIDGIDLNRLRLDRWRERTSACFQDYLKLELVTRESIGAGYLPLIEDERRVTSAVGRAAATDVLGALPAGLESQLGSRFGGVDLSGGQWQKIAIARAMMRDEPLLLALDEPTAALDALAEQQLFRGYANAAREFAQRNGAITILVSHRFSTVRMADVIAVLDRGRLAEFGAHDELMQARGLYAELYELQARHYR